MIPVTQYAGLPVAVLGLGRAGLASACALMKGGANVWAWDDSPAARGQATIEGVPLVDLSGANMHETTTLVMSPGIPLHHPKPHPVAQQAKVAGCEIIGEVELLSRTDREATYVGITGTNGKSTTTALIGHIFDVARRRAAVGGNLGQPALDLDHQGEDGIYVLEMSSYQLDLTMSARFNVAVWLNLSPDHLDRHGGLDGYVAAKKRIFANQKIGDTAVIGIDDERSIKVFEDAKTRPGIKAVPISSSVRAKGGVFVLDGLMFDDLDGVAEMIMDVGAVATLPGAHNWQNAAAAYAAARSCGIDRATIIAAIKTYPGLPHRQEIVPGPDDILYVNDSKATNVDAAIRALESYENIYWIAGGRAKDGGFAGLEPGLKNVRHALLIGEAMDALATFLGKSVPYSKAETMDVAVRQARTLAVGQAAKRPVVLLSPACASFDQFDSFEARGDAFRDLVSTLSDEQTEARSAGGAA